MFVRSARHRIRLLAAPILVAATLTLSGCGEELQHGYVLSEDALSQVQVGSSREQVMLVLGTPSTTATFGNEAFYYISTKTARPVAFMNHETTDQRVLAVYFDDKSRVREIANYGMQDGKVFDFISRKTKAGGADISFLGQIMKSNMGNPLAGLGQ
jgi:outer membrane protein assembly factor BamE (lipoprotein component of BamABCDE complex)